MNYDYTLNADGVPTVALSVEAPENVSLEMNEVAGKVPQIAKTTEILKGDNNGNAVAAEAGTDYQTPLQADVDYQTPLTAGMDYWQPPVIVTLSNGQGGTYTSSLSDAEIFAAAVSGRFVYVTLQQAGRGVILPLTCIAYSPDPLDNMGVIFSASMHAASIGTMYTVHIVGTTAYFTERNIQNSITVNGILRGSDGTISAAVEGFDYQAPLPSQTGKNGKYLKTDGSAMSWDDAPAAPVTSVNSKTGAVSLDASDVGALPDSIDVDEVKQNHPDPSNYSYWRPLVVGKSSNQSESGAFADQTGELYAFDAIRVQPSTGMVKATTFKGVGTDIPYGAVDSGSTSTVINATVPGVTELRHGTRAMIKNGVVTSAAGFTLNVNGLGAKPVYTNLAAATAESTKFNVNYTLEFFYDETRVTGGCWVIYNGYDSNTNTIGYQLRTNSLTLPLKTYCGRYRLLFTSADGETLVPANADTQTSAAKTHTVTTEKIDPFGEIFYYGSTAVKQANESPAATVLWQQYVVTLGYSFNSANAALSLTSLKPVYIKATPQSDGSAVLDYFTQDRPTTNDGKIYIFLGIAVSATTVEMTMKHPIYYHDGTRCRIWNG